MAHFAVIEWDLVVARAKGAGCPFTMDAHLPATAVNDVRFHPGDVMRHVVNLA